MLPAPGGMPQDQNMAAFAMRAGGQIPVPGGAPPAGPPPMPMGAQPPAMPPGMSPQGMPPMPPPQGMLPPPVGANGAPPSGGRPILPPGAGAAPGGMPPGGMNPQMLMQLVQQLAAMGRNGDSMIAHLTPGEIAVPPQVQTPKVLATLDKAFDKSGTEMEQFTAGSPQSSVNPQTNMAEYNFMSAFLPAALGLAGSAAMPWLAPALAASSPLLAGAIGSGAGSALGGLLGGQKPMQALLGGLGSGVGGYALGSLFSPAAAGAAGEAAKGAAAPAVAQAAAANGGVSASAPLGQAAASGALPWSPAGQGMAQQAATRAALTTGAPGPANLWGVLPQNINPMAAAGSAIGGQIGSSMGAPTPKTSTPKPSGFDDHFPPVGELPSWQQAIGQNTYNGPVPNFTGYNAMAPNSTAFSFFPPAAQPVQLPKV